MARPSLAALHAAFAAERVTLVTPNRRLAAYHKREFDLAQLAGGQTAWPTPDILPFSTFVERSWYALSLAGEHASPPRLIDSVQSQLLWEQVIRKSATSLANALMNIAQTARQAAAAWMLVHAWQLLPAMQKFALHEDATMFLSWSRRYRESCHERNVIDVATLPDALAVLVAAVAKDGMTLPGRVLLAGFDIATPQQHLLWRAFRDAGVPVDPVEADGKLAGAQRSRIEFANETDEMRTCAAWARRQLENNPQRRIAIVVPDLEAKRGRIARELTDALIPAARANGASREPAASSLFNVSLGQPLGEYALVGDALAMLELSLMRPVPFLTVSALLRSPFVGGAEQEMAARARLDAMLREHAPPEIALPSLRARAAGARGGQHAAGGTLGVVIERVFVLAEAASGNSRARNSPSAPHDWSRHFGRVLTAWGFPGERPLESIDYQVLGKFRDALTSLAALAIVQPRMRGEEALLQLRRIAADNLFQAESGHGNVAPIQVLGILESAGQSFDALWVTGLSDDAWPLVARPNAFIPAALQRSAGIPEASAVAALTLDTRITEGWLNSADEVVLSHARLAEGHGATEQERKASALIRDIPLTSPSALLSTGMPCGYAAALQAIGNREAIPDEALKPLPKPTAIRGGASVMRDQAACPFRAFARHRLGAKPLDTPAAGPDAMERGNLLHRVLYLVWGTIENHLTLAGLDQAEAAEIVNTAVKQAIAEADASGVANLSGRFAMIERTRLSRLVTAWLDYERERTPFTVVGREVARTVTLAGLTMDLRLDRVDQLADGTHALIDYKTGTAKLASWLGERPDEPQLPLYCHSADEPVSALAFARVKRGERGKVFGFEGLSAVEGLLPDVMPVEMKAPLKKLGIQSWDVLMQKWDSAMNTLARNFSEGQAAVDPKHGGITCAQCELHSVCRIAEAGRYAALEIGAGVVEPGEAETNNA